MKPTRRTFRTSIVATGKPDAGGTEVGAREPTVVLLPVLDDPRVPSSAGVATAIMLCAAA
jgi:hypothetical protein